MAARTLIRVDDYLRTAYPELDCEYVDGEVFEKPMPPKSHARVQARLIEIFYELRTQAPFIALPEMRMQTEPTRFRIPDVAVYVGAEPEGDVPTQPPYIAIEILSPDDRMQYLLAKLKEYRNWGAAHVWVIDPASRTLSVFEADGLKEVDSLALPEHGVTLTRERLFAPHA